MAPGVMKKVAKAKEKDNKKYIVVESEWNKRIMQ